MATKRTRSFGKWRTATLVGVHLLFIAHFIHWKLRGRTLAPLEFNEVLYTIHQGIVTAGFIFMALVMVATLFFGRFFCSWGCHILALQDACGWMMDKLRIPRTSIRSRTLVWIPFVVMGYLFIWPQILALFHGLDPASLHVVEASAAGGWSSFSTDNLWRNLPPPGIAVLTFFICGFLIVYLLGSRGFCFQACPYGALFSIADQFAPGRIALNVAKDCTSCGLCTKACTSDILVHKELAQHGMVTNPRCMKDLDCIAACPEDAITYGFRKPPLFRKGHPLGTYAGRYSFSLGEDILLAVVFLIAMFIFRGLYDAVAFLMAVGLSVCTAYLVLMGFRLWKRKTMKVRGLVLRSDGRLHSAGVAYGVVVLALVAFTVHSGFVQFLTWQGKSAFKELAGAPAGKIDRTELDEAISHYEKALYYGLVAPIDRRKELANLYLLAGQAPKAITLLEGIVEQDPEHVEARYRLGELAMAAGDRKRALEHWSKTLELGKPRPHGRDEELLGNAALQVGIDWPVPARWTKHVRCSNGRSKECRGTRARSWPCPRWKVPQDMTMPPSICWNRPCATVRKRHWCGIIWARSIFGRGTGRKHFSNMIALCNCAPGTAMRSTPSAWSRPGPATPAARVLPCSTLLRSIPGMHVPGRPCPCLITKGVVPGTRLTNSEPWHTDRSPSSSFFSC
ncbi:MAG: 4Fe-4S binding protein [Flavobacteriales bacterium]|nr:4Fe-4S binding protein [Flavobacteriales bacterium]